MQDFAVNNFIGSKSLEYNLKLIPQGYDMNIVSMKQEDYDYIMNGINQVLPQPLVDKIWDMIWERWHMYETICNQKE